MEKKNNLKEYLAREIASKIHEFDSIPCGEFHHNMNLYDFNELLGYNVMKRENETSELLKKMSFIFEKNEHIYTSTSVGCKVDLENVHIKINFTITPKEFVEPPIFKNKIDDEDRLLHLNILSEKNRIRLEILRTKDKIEQVKGNLDYSSRKGKYSAEFQSLMQMKKEVMIDYKISLENLLKQLECK